jgi:MFS family permease
MAFFGEIRMDYLYVVCFLNGIAQVFFELAYHSYIPTLIDRADLVQANGKIQTSISFAEVGGPALAGFLVEWITAPFALLVDSISFLISAFATASIRKPEMQTFSSMSMGKMIENIRQGFRMVTGIPHLRALAGESATFNLFGIIFQTAFTLYATRDLGLAPAILGLIYMMGSVGSLMGAMASDALTNRLGLGKAMVTAFLLACVPYSLLLFLSDSNSRNIAILTITFLLSGMGISSSQIYIWSIRQAVTPEGKLGRMNAAYRFFVTGVTPIASLVGGFLGEAIGLRSTVLAGALGCILILPWIYFSPLPALQKLPEVVHLDKESNIPLVVSAD